MDRTYHGAARRTRRQRGAIITCVQDRRQRAPRCGSRFARDAQFQCLPAVIGRFVQALLTVEHRGQLAVGWREPRIERDRLAQGLLRRAIVAKRAASVLATDVNESVLALARGKPYPRNNVSFRRLDIYSDERVTQRFDAGLAAFWWSHVPRQDLGRFVEHFHRRLEADARVVYLDNRYVEGSSSPLTRTDAHGNTYQMRSLDDGSRYEVLKNIPDASELADALGDRAQSLDYVELEYFWYASYRVVVP